MKSLFSIVIAAALVGVALGASLGYLEARMPEYSPSIAKQPDESDNSAKKGPIAQLAERTYHFNVIERGTSMTHVFKIRNVGDSPLKLKVASTTCKCTAGELSKDVVSPGEESDIELEWTAKTPPGPFRHGATLSTNDPSNSHIELVVEGDVVDSSTLEPTELILGTVRSGETQKVSVFLISNVQEDVDITDYELSAPELKDFITLSFDKLAKEDFPERHANAKGMLKVTATCTGGKKLGPFFSWLELHTNLEKAQKLTVPISGNVVGDISVFGPGWVASRNVLRLDAIKSSEGKSVRLNVAVRGEHATDTKLKVASVDPPELKVTLGEAKPMSDTLVHYPMTVEVPVGTRPMIRMTRQDEDDPISGDGSIVVSSDNPEIAEFRLRVRFSVE